MAAVALLSGGLDSITAALLATGGGEVVHALALDYGQRHRVELERAATLSAHFVFIYHLARVSLSDWGGSALTDPGVAVPTGGLSEGIPPTYVPGRNTVFIALALSLAEAVGADQIVLGINSVDYSGYPDCRPEYLEAYSRLADLATRAGLEGRGPRLIAPLQRMHKVEIVQAALELGVPIELTWSCYLGGAEPCGRCDSCRIRDAALAEAGRIDLMTAVGQAALQAGG